MDFQDYPLICRDCGNDFLFTAGEQDFYRTKGFTKPPGRCPACRYQRKLLASQLGAPQASASASLSDTSDPTASPMPESPQPLANPSLLEVTAIECAKCGKATTIPFRPKLSRPLFCAECYAELKSPVLMEN